jgi:hypothetical protein
LGFGFGAGGGGGVGAGSGGGTVEVGGGEGSAGGGGADCANALVLANPSTPTARIAAAITATLSAPCRRLAGDAGARLTSALLSAPTDSP